MLCDADVLIWVLRKHRKAIHTVESLEERALSVATYMELVRGARDKRELREIRDYISEYDFRMLPLTESVGHKASLYMEEYGLSTGLGVVDALVAATAAENNLALLTGNVRHYKAIAGLEVKAFRG